MARGTKTVAETVPTVVPMIAGALYDVEQFGKRHTVLCLGVEHTPKGRIGTFSIRGYPEEYVAEGSERGQMFKLIHKPGA